VRRIVLVAADRIVVAQLLARPDGADCLDEHTALIGDRLAVWTAAVVDETRLIAVGARIDDHAAVDDEQEGVAVPARLAFVAPVRFAVGNALAQIFHDARALADAAGGEYPQAVHGGAAHAVQSRP